MSIDPKSFMHPFDEAAMESLELVPGIGLLRKRCASVGFELFLQGFFMGTCIRLSKTQLPEIYGLLPPVCEAFGIDEPEFFLQRDGSPNAFTIGNRRPMIVVTSGLLLNLENEEERRAVIAHECGHIVCRHVFYSTMARALVFMGSMAFDIVKALEAPLAVALNYWSRRSELSADRAASLYSGSIDPMVRGLLRLTGGPSEITGRINVREFAAQAEKYESIQDDSKMQKFMQGAAVLGEDHPYTAVRVNELVKWDKSPQFKKAIGRILPKRPFQAAAVSKECPQCRAKCNGELAFCRRCGANLMSGKRKSRPFGQAGFTDRGL